MATRLQVTFDVEQHRRAADKAARMGISLAEYIRRVVAADLDPPAAVDADISEIFGLGDSGGSDVARQKDAYLGAAVSERRAGRAPTPR
jgi:hypothetical protein